MHDTEITEVVDTLRNALESLTSSVGVAETIASATGDKGAILNSQLILNNLHASHRQLEVAIEMTNKLVGEKLNYLKKRHSV